MVKSIPAKDKPMYDDNWVEETMPINEAPIKTTGMLDVRYADNRFGKKCKKDATINESKADERTGPCFFSVLKKYVKVEPRIPVMKRTNISILFKQIN